MNKHVFAITLIGTAGCIFDTDVTVDSFGDSDGPADSEDTRGDSTTDDSRGSGTSYTPADTGSTSDTTGTTTASEDTSTTEGASTTGEPEGPCQPLQDCLNLFNTMAERCEHYGECTLLFHPPGVSCEPTCTDDNNNVIPCDEACTGPEECVQTYQCIFSQEGDICSLDNQFDCFGTSGDCQGWICLEELACEQCI